MSLAIVMPCYNQLEVTKVSLKSLLENTHSEYTLIAVDDCSADGTQRYFEEICKTQTHVSYIRNPTNFGVNRSWNIGVKKVQQLGVDRIAIVNNDLLYTAGWEVPLLKVLENPTVGVVSPLSTFGAIPKDWPKGIKRAPNPAGYVGYMPILGACFMCRTELFDTIGYFPEELRIYYGDNWIVLASQAKGFKCGYATSYIHHLFCQTSSKLNNSAIWPHESPIFDKIAKSLGQLKPFVKKGEPWQITLNRWLD